VQVSIKIRYNSLDGKIEIYNTLFTGNPVYYHLNQAGEFFVSNRISLLRKVGVELRENFEALPEYFTFGIIFPPRTIFTHIYQLPTGRKLFLKVTKGEVHITGFQDECIDTRKKRIPEEKIVETIFNYITDSIRVLEPLTNKACFLLSGGMDSTILFKVWEYMGFNIDTYSAGYAFEDPNYEKEYAVSAAEAFDVRHENFEITEDEYKPALIDTIYRSEAPLPAMQSVLLHLLLKKYLPRHKHLVINGDHGEAMGYKGEKYNVYYYKKSLNYKFLNFLDKNIHPLYNLIKARAPYYPKVSCEISDPNNILWHPRGDIEWVLDYFKTTTQDAIDNRVEVIKNFQKESLLDTIQYRIVINGANEDELWGKLADGNRRIFHFSYTYPPYIKYSFQIPYDIMYKTPRYFFDKIARELNVPEFILTRKKLGFNPITKLPNGFFDPLIQLASKIMDIETLSSMRDFNLMDNRFWTLWYSLNYSIWKRLWIKDEAKDALIEEIT
jgi:asparagine synthetase B (glutamine-hydrolysing)